MEPASDSSMPEVVLDADFLAQLNSPDSRALLDTIDSLREIHVGDLVDLPQIIVVGDQSSGKSSVLEAISRVRFPVDGDLCTRFATELILRRSNKVAVNVSIQPANDAASTTHGGGGERRPFQRSTFNEDALPDIIREAKELMGIGENGVKKFSRDILRVEIAKPDMYPITLVDLPGIFHSETADQDLEGKQIVDQLIESYMSQEKSIILAVVATNNQLANQSVLQEAKKHDPERKRTIGVITKPDLADPGSANERKYLDLAKGRENMHNLALGWYVLRNSSEQERSSGAENRDTVEERFFATGAWSSISPANRGVESLRKRLSRVLLDHVKASLPGLIQDIRTNLRTRQEDLDRLGKARSSTEEQRSYLLGVAHEYQRLAHDAIEGRYSNNLGFFGGIGQSEKKLRAVIRNSNRAFHAVMESKGGRYKILREDEDNASDSLHEVNHQLPEYVRFLIEEYDIPDPETKDESTLKAELQSLACFNHGREFPGEANEELALQLFRDQAEPWQDIAWKHLKQVLRVTQDFVDRAFIHVIGADEKTQEAILNCYVNPFFESKEEELSGKLGELLLPYSNGYGPPLEAEFISIMRRRTNERLAVRLSRQFQEDLEFDQDEHLNRDKILRTFRNLEDSDIDEFGTEKVIDLMTAYYEMSLRTFIDNIINLAAESCLIRDIPTILTPMKVDAMSANTLEELASESEEVQIQRRRLEDEVKILREGLRKCQRHERRELPARPTASVRHSSGAAPGQTPSRAVTPSPAPTPGRDSTSSLAASASHQPKIISPNVMLRASQTSSSQTLSSQGRDFSSTPSVFATPAGSTSFSLNQPIFGNSTAAASPAPKPSLFGGSPGHTSSSLSQPIFGTNTGAAKPAPTSSLFTSTASRPQDGNTGDTTGSGATGGRLFGEGFVNTNTAVPFGGSGPSISRSAFGAATNLQNTSSGARHNRHSGFFGGSQMRDKIRYDGMDAIPSSFMYSVTVKEEGGIDCHFNHICFQPMFKNFSPEELRLKSSISL